MHIDEVEVRSRSSFQKFEKIFQDLIDSRKKKIRSNTVEI